MSTTHLSELANEAARYGNMARVAATFYISTGNDAEARAAYFYARYAARAVYMAERQALIDTTELHKCVTCGRRYVRHEDAQTCAASWSWTERRCTNQPAEFLY